MRISDWSSDVCSSDLALFSETLKRGLRVVSGRGIQTTGPASAAALITSEEDTIRLTREEIDKWHAADTGDVNTALISSEEGRVGKRCVSMCRIGVWRVH